MSVLSFPETGTNRRTILNAIRRNPKRGLTDAEIVARTGLNENTMRHRRLELVKGGWVADSGLTRTNSTGVEVTVWQLSDFAREVYAA